ncbi:hypothetical protein [Magnetococcus sp. PR-3]|uniref:hypothetical protein n=1 Tax=Magnetococcus sp. PR-3 TaxID=3120355 RepID=UPI002FCDFBFD
MSIELYLSADYELYFARNRLPEAEVLIPPTQQLMAQCEAVHAPLTLFCDVACLMRYQQWGELDFVRAVEQQLQEAIRRGHDVQLHLHPHWFRTQRDDQGGYQFAPEDYLLGSYEPDPAQQPAQFDQMIGQGKAYLETLLQGVDSHYQCNSFRGGGYGLQPGTEALFTALQKHGVVVDSSVVPGYYLKTAVHRVDFREMVGRSNQWFGPEHGLSSSAPKGGGLFEVPIGAANLPDVPSWNAWPEALGRCMNTLRYGGPAQDPRGEPVGWQSPPLLPWHKRPKQAWWDLHAVRNRGFAKLEMHSSSRLMLAIMEGHLEREAPYEGTHYLSMNGHPKGMFQPHFHALGQFVKQVRARYGQGVHFLTFTDLAQRFDGS